LPTPAGRGPKQKFDIVPGLANCQMLLHRQKFSPNSPEMPGKCLWAVIKRQSANWQAAS